MGYYKVILLSFVFCCLGPVFSEEVAVKSAPVSEYIDEKGGYAIKFPSSWDVQTGVMGTDVIALSPKDNPEDLFRENVNIIHAKLDFPITQDEYYRINLESLEQLLTDFDLEESKNVMIDGVEGKQYIYTHRMGVVNAKVMQYLVLVGNDAYVITFTTDPMVYSDYEQKFKEIMKSFKFSKE